MTYRALRAIAIWLIAAAVSGPAAWAAPKSMLVADYENFLKGMEQAIEKKVSDTHKADEQNLDLLAKPLELGSKVSVRVRKGGQYVETVEGTFRDLNIQGNPQLVQIGDRRFNYKDVVEIDQKRLYWGAQKDRSRLVLEIERERRKLEEDKEQLRRVERNARLDQEGYTREWFARVIQLSGWFRYVTDLGDQNMELELEVDATSPLARVTLNNRTGQPSVATVYFDRRQVASNLPAEFSTEFPSPVWESHSFWILKEDLGTEALSAVIAKKFRVALMADKVGKWLLMPNSYPAGQVRREMSNVEVCPLCYGAGEIPPFAPAAVAPSPEAAPAPAAETGGDQPAAEPAAPATEAAATPTVPPAVIDPAATAEAIQKEFQATANTLMACPRCRGEKQIASEEPHQIVRVTHRLKLVPQDMEDYSPQAAAKYITAARKVVEYQAQVDKLVDEIKKAALAKLIEEDQATREEQAKRDAEMRRQRAAEEFYKRIRENYVWLTADQAVARGDRRIDEFRTACRFDDIDFPTSITDLDGKTMKIVRFSEWYPPAKTFEIRKLKPRYQLTSLLYRVLEGEKGPDDFQYYLQYRVEVDTTSMFEPLRLKTSVLLTLKSDTGEAPAEGAPAPAKGLSDVATFTLPPTRVSHAIGTFAVDTATVGTGFADISLDAQVLQ